MDLANDNYAAKKYEYDDFFKTSSYSAMDKQFYLSEGENRVKIKIDVSEHEFQSERYYYIKKTSDENTSIIEKITELKNSGGLLKTPIDTLLEELSLEESRRISEDIPANKHPSNDNKRGEERKKLWVDKYMPKTFSELLSDDKINRNFLTWLKSWDQPVFQRKKVVHNYSIFRSNAERKYDGRGSSESNNTTFKGGFNKENQTFVKKWTNIFDLNDPECVHNLRNSVVLLAGPPGTGKTTLARTIGRNCGYHIIEINASDDRTAEKLIDKIEASTQTENIGTKTGEKLPTMIILDEVDGTAEGDGNMAIDAVLNYIFKGEKPNGKAAAMNKKAKAAPKKKPGFLEELEQGLNLDDENQNQGEAGAKAKKTLAIKRPILFICNDPYSKGLRELRKKAILFNFRKGHSEKFVKRLKDICAYEGLPINNEILCKICEDNEYDIRSCLNQLELISKTLKRRRGNNPKLDIRDSRYLLSLSKEFDKGLMSVIEDVILKNLDSSLKSAPSSRERNLTGHFMYNLLKNVDHYLLIEGVMINYPRLKTVERNFEILPKFLSKVSDSDILDRKIKNHQAFEMSKYLTLYALFFFLNFSTTEKLKLDFPFQYFQRKKEKKMIEEKLINLLKAAPSSFGQMVNRKKFASDALSYLYQIIQPNISTSILNEIEKDDLKMAINVMLDFDIKLLASPWKFFLRLTDNDAQWNQGQQINRPFIELNYDPHIERLLVYSNRPPNTRLSQKAKTLINNNYEYVKNVRISVSNAEENPNEHCEKRIKADTFFSLDLKEEGKRLRRRNKISEGAGFVYKFLEGVNNAVKYDLNMEYFFKEK